MLSAGETTTSPARVAILDDHLIFRESLAMALAAGGVDVVGQYGDGATFLNALSSITPDVAIVDLSLETDDGESAIDGIEVLRAMNHGYPSVKALVLSARRDPDLVEQVHQLGAGAFLHKSNADQAGLIRAIQMLRSGTRTVSPDRFVQELAAHSGGQSSPRSPLADLTHREHQVLACLASGADNLKIAAILQIKERTVRAYVSSLYRKLGRENRAELALLARDLGVVPRAG